jgi:hypothetical protein
LSLYNAYNPQYTTNIKLHKDFAFFKENGISYIALPLYWYRIETARGEYDDDFLSNVKNVITIASQYGLRVMLSFQTLWGTDSLWCTPNYAIDPYSNEKIGLAIVRSSDIRQDFVSMFNHTVSYLAGTKGILCWAILNEPWYWGRTPTEHDFITDNGKTQEENFVDLFATLSSTVRHLDDNPVTIMFCSTHLSAYGNVNDIFTDDWQGNKEIFNCLDFIGFDISIPTTSDNPDFAKIDRFTQANLQICYESGRKVWITGFGSGINDDALQRESYRFNIDYFQSKGVATIFCWEWMSDVAPSGYNQTPGFQGFNLAKNDGTARPAFYEIA